MQIMHFYNKVLLIQVAYMRMFLPPGWRIRDLEMFVDVYA